MNKVIYKVALTQWQQTIAISKDVTFLTVQLQNDYITLWYLTDPLAPKDTIYTFTVIGTGWDIVEDPGKYLGTIQTEEEFVWHVFVK